MKNYERSPDALRSLLERLPARQAASAEKAIHAGLFIHAEAYAREHQHHFTGASPKSPAFVKRELTALGNALLDVAEKRLLNISPEALRAIVDYSGDLEQVGWWSTLESIPRLIQLGHFIKRVPNPKREADPREFLIRWVILLLKPQGASRTHVLPIAKAVHSWATDSPPHELGQDWGKPFLDRWWPPKSRG